MTMPDAFAHARTRHRGPAWRFAAVGLQHAKLALFLR